MNIESLNLELTRMCTLECEHCLREDRSIKYMSKETIKNIFKDIKTVDMLLLTGGEPLLAVAQIREIIKIVKENNIKINISNLTKIIIFNIIHKRNEGYLCIISRKF